MKIIRKSENVKYVRKRKGDWKGERGTDGDGQIWPENLRKIV
jgi:hypothetical protein